MFFNGEKNTIKLCVVTTEFEKWRAIRDDVGGMGDVLVWVAC